jgi:hypothetical protein
VTSAFGTHTAVSVEGLSAQISVMVLVGTPFGCVLQVGQMSPAPPSPPPPEVVVVEVLLLELDVVLELVVGVAPPPPPAVVEVVPEPPVGGGVVVVGVVDVSSEQPSQLTPTHRNVRPTIAQVKPCRETKRAMTTSMNVLERWRSRHSPPPTRVPRRRPGPLRRPPREAKIDHSPRQELGKGAPSLWPSGFVGPRRGRGPSCRHVP